MGLFDNFRKSHKPNSTGKFIVIDGAKNTGKTTQTDLLAGTLEVSGYNGMLLDFPQYGEAGAAILEKYHRGEYGDLSPEATSILYAIDRFDSSFKLREHLNSGSIVLANRYVSSNAGHQGAKITDYNQRVKFYKWLDNLEYTTFGIPRPDLTIILHIPSDIALELISQQIKKGDKTTGINKLDKEYLETVERVYMEMAGLFPNTKLVECVEEGRLLTPKEVHAKVWELTRRIVLKDITPNPL